MKDRRITRAATLMLVLLNVGLFAFVWLNYYNYYAFRSHRTEGAIGAIAAYYILYRWLSKLYRAYSIAASSIEETVLSQFISFGISDLALYIASILLRRNSVSVIPGAVTVALQLVGSTLIIWLMKRYMLRHIKPSPTLLVYGGPADLEQSRRFVERLMKKYAHLFSVERVVNERDTEGVLAGIDACDVTIFTEVDLRRRAAFMEHCLERRKVFFFVPMFSDIITRGCSVKNFLDTPLMRYDYSYEKRRSYVVKRACDIVFSLLFLILLSPVMLVTAIAVHAEDGGPVFFKQERVTLEGRTFNIMKFRSMVVDAERYGALPATENDPRVTKVGRLIRKTRVDELPQMFNILLGHMSFVGPRPERILHVTLYEQQVPEFKYRLRVKGGLTGYAQVYGKYNTSPEDKLRLDMLYIENQSLLLDFKLIMLTIKIMFRPESTEGFDEAQSQSINRQNREENQENG